VVLAAGAMPCVSELFSVGLRGGSSTLSLNRGTTYLGVPSSSCSFRFVFFFFLSDSRADVARFRPRFCLGGDLGGDVAGAFRALERVAGIGSVLVLACGWWWWCGGWLLCVVTWQHAICLFVVVK
jgi:hypothetical protein